jgi:hypothetical protein
MMSPTEKWLEEHIDEFISSHGARGEDYAISIHELAEALDEFFASRGA